MAFQSTIDAKALLPIYRAATEDEPSPEAFRAFLAFDEKCGGVTR